MAREHAQRLKPFYILDFLRLKSDEEHPVTAKEICAELEKNGIPAERKSVYRDIAALCDYGFDIVKSSYPRGWFLASREFEEPEIYLLTDAVRTAKFISPQKTRELIKKLDGFVSEYRAIKREKRVYFAADSKCGNEQIFYSIDKISTAISSAKKISFQYAGRVLSDNREPVLSLKNMVISPYALTWQDDHYYVIGNYAKYDNLIHLRVDRMYSVKITDEKSRRFSEVSPYRDFFDTADYTSRLFGMYGGELTEVEFCCSKKMTEQVYDRFGENIFSKNVTDETFGFTVNAALSEALVSWVMGYGENIRVVSPTALADMITKRAEKIIEIYRGRNNEKGI